MSTAAQEEEPVQVEIIGYQGARKRILVVDDKPEMRLVLNNMLYPLGFEVRRAGMPVTLAQNGQEAVTTVRLQPKESPLDLILIDLMMLVDLL